MSVVQLHVNVPDASILGRIFSQLTLDIRGSLQQCLSLNDFRRIRRNLEHHISYQQCLRWLVKESSLDKGT
eukprot:scaffold140_cov565-Prasinococcus_capsulatus_cf.AAC.16